MNAPAKKITKPSIKQEVAGFWAELTYFQKAILLILIAILAWMIYKKVKGIGAEITETVLTKTEVEILAANGITPTYSSADYKLWADRLQYAMEGGGTKIEIVNSIFSWQKNNADIIALEKAFGLRLSSSTAFWLYGFGPSPTNLSDWLKGDLSPEELADLNAQLKSQGISRRV